MHIWIYGNMHIWKCWSLRTQDKVTPADTDDVEFGWFHLDISVFYLQLSFQDLRYQLAEPDFWANIKHHQQDQVSYY